MAQPKVSIIVPVYNAEQYLEKCINSLRNQTIEDIEMFLKLPSNKQEYILNNVLTKLIKNAINK